MNARRTDLALEAHALFRAAQRDDAIDGLTLTERTRRGCAVTTVTVESKAASRALGKPRGTYVTLDLRAISPEDPAYTERAALALRDELRALLEGTVDTALVVGLGNRAMTPDVIGPRAADHVPATRHLKGCAAFDALADVSVLTPGVLGTTGLEAAELVRGAVETVRPDLVVAVDALASQSLGRVCTTVQLTDAGIVPGSGVGNPPPRPHARDARRSRSRRRRPHRGGRRHARARPFRRGRGGPSRSRRPARTGERHGHAARHRRARRAACRVVGFGVGLALQPSLSLDELRALID